MIFLAKGKEKLIISCDYKDDSYQYSKICLWVQIS